ncbi:GNAT family N-acetyltransferase [Halobellus sp. EA9]|uniref:GNAT family N-acetyltransferase n=1 Tax=Halobellus sp. EA9 TaxID=3421647 RepID=UPI003EB831B9
MEFAVLGWPPEGPQLRLDYRRFAYAGKFVMSNTGKAVVREAEEPAADGSTAEDSTAGDTATDDAAAGADADFEAGVAAALAFNADRTEDATLWYRYVTVRDDAKGNGLGPRLAAFVAPRAADRGYDRLRIAVNNPFAYEAMYKAGFAWTGRETGVAELVLERPADPAAAAGRDRPGDRYRAGLDRFRARDPADPEASFLAAREGADPPAVLADLADPTVDAVERPSTEADPSDPPADVDPDG